LLKVRKEGGKLRGGLLSWLGFMALQGSFGYDEREDLYLVRDEPDLAGLAARPVGRRPLPIPAEPMTQRRGANALLAGFVFYLSLVEPRVCRVLGLDADGTEDKSASIALWALWDRVRESLAVFYWPTLEIHSFGTEEMAERLDAHLDAWRELGEPGVHQFDVTLRPRDVPEVPSSTWTLELAWHRWEVSLSSAHPCNG
jgi:hypothetical protein